MFGLKKKPVKKTLREEDFDRLKDHIFELQEVVERLEIDNDYMKAEVKSIRAYFD